VTQIAVPPRSLPRSTCSSVPAAALRVCQERAERDEPETDADEVHAFSVGSRSQLAVRNALPGMKIA
jgi:hypothetical protein